MPQERGVVILPGAQRDGPTWWRECIRCAYAGQAHFEYALILAFMALVLAISLAGMAAHLNNTLIAIANSLPHIGG